MPKRYTTRYARKCKIIVAVLIMMFVTVSCKAPQRMQTEFDGLHWKATESVYIGKPLKYLLKDIKSPIKIVYAEGGRQAHGTPSYFVFLFYDSAERTARQKAGLSLPRLTVYVKDTFEWNRQAQPLPQRMQWTKKDMRTYGNLIVVYFRSTGGVL